MIIIKEDPLSQIMGVEEAASLWGTTPSYVNSLCDQGKVRAIKIGKNWVLDKPTEP
ncbi:helix-turn-helix domain-containing protein [Desulfotomaculum sp. 1211_IL3151]|uniref:helix-turn-helix domain-containing protein n=1 Tax=Desulfotomaculum sp. 1211_IL3151 TaxID=3084055 RepID=UPI002FDAD7BF